MSVYKCSLKSDDDIVGIVKKIFKRGNITTSEKKLHFRQFNQFNAMSSNIQGLFECIQQNHQATF